MKKTADKINTESKLSALVEEWKANNQKIVFTNGCFDIMHLGHVDYLEKAAALGDRLIVGVNSDQSVSKLKGPSRPINDEYARMRLLAALEFVSAVVVFNDDTPLRLIEQFTPDVLVKGEDYSIDRIVGADHVIDQGGQVKTIKFVEGYSTSNIVKKILNG